jgi:predicted TIM-barrel fold metal-dependent hydrolase
LIIDCHVHAVADTPGHGRISAKLRRSLTFCFLRWRLNIRHTRGEAFEREAEAKLVNTINSARPLDAAVVLAFDAVYDRDGKLDLANTHLHVTNDYVAELAKRHPKIFFAASVHPYRKDAVAELERCVARGAVLLKWLPLTQNFNPSDPLCFPIYEALAHFRLPLLCHTGGEQALPILAPDTADPALLVPALERGVTVIAAHCGTRGHILETNYLPTFARLAHRYENLYGDTAALNLPTRNHAYYTLLKDKVVRSKLLHGSDWPILAIPPLRIGWREALRLVWQEGNWMRRDALVKERVGFDEEYWHRAATVLRLPGAAVGK